MHTFSSLKEKQRSIRSGFSSDVGLRVHRCLSWLNRAEQASDDFDAAFIFYWISFNAAYAEEIGEATIIGERSAFDGFFRKLIELDSDNQIYDAIWDKFSQSIRLFLDNQYIFQPFWKHQNHIDGYDDWNERFNKSKRRFNSALANHDTRAVLGMLFDRLYVLRNQLLHGGATWNSSVNRDQVRDGARILGFLVPIFVDLMMDNPDKNWGLPYYPVVD
tara:strand:- start:64779 stop:65432 length:654 start_codon:yes stop_codon:yes gene_type:complete